MLNFWTAILAMAVGFFIIYCFFMRKDYFTEHGIPHENPWIILWNMVNLFVFRKILHTDHIMNYYRLNEDAKYIGMYDFGAKAIIIRDLELLKNITVKHFDHFTDHTTYTDADREPLLSNNLFFLHGDKWRETRHLITPTFTTSKMKAMFKLMSECAATFSNSIREQCINESKEYDSKDIFTRYANDTVATCAFGVAVDSMKDPHNEIYVLGRNATNFGGIKSLKLMVAKMFPRLSKILGLKVIEVEIENFFFNLIRDTIAMRDKQGIHRPDMIQLMMETRSNDVNSRTTELSIEYMTSQAFIFYLGGFESTATLMCFVAHQLAIFPDVQKRLQEEIAQVMESCNGKPTYESINNMEYLDAVINETLRLYPINAAMDRVCTKSYELPPTLPGSKPALLKTGDTIWYPIAAMHRDSKYFPRPDEFDPDRFIGDARAENNFNAYLPFGLGPRMCIGNRFGMLETKVLFLHLLAKFDLSPGNQMILPMKLSKKTFAYMAEGGFWLHVKPR